MSLFTAQVQCDIIAQRLVHYITSQCHGQSSWVLHNVKCTVIAQSEIRVNEQRYIQWCTGYIQRQGGGEKFTAQC